MTTTEKKTEFDNRLFVINKESGPTSFDVVTAFRRATGLRKVGHTGTLDPLATGILLLCSGVATRAVEHFMDLEKTYEFDVHLGVETTTLDAEGKIVREAPCPDIPQERIEAAARSFLGVYEHTPPVFSAIKHNGRRLYEMARDGQDPDIPARAVSIYAFEVMSVALPIVSCRVRCSRGTYVRSVARDLGQRLGLPAHVARLSRTAVGPFAVADAFPSGEITQDGISALSGYNLASALDFLPGVVLSEQSKRALYNGGLPGSQDVVRMIGTINSGDPVRLMDEGGELIAVGRRKSDPDRNRLYLVDSYRLYLDARKG